MCDASLFECVICQTGMALSERTWAFELVGESWGMEFGDRTTIDDVVEKPTLRFEMYLNLNCFVKKNVIFLKINDMN